jgi:SAM-dependent methyltransferase
MSTKRITTTLDDERTWPGTADRATFVSHVARYRFALQWVQPQYDLLETGCGTGYGTNMLAERARSVVGVDYSPVALAYAVGNFCRPNLTFLRMDCHRLGFADRSFDGIVSFEVFEHLEDQKAYLAECRRVLRTGGFLLLSTPNHTTTTIHMNSIGMRNDFHVGEVDLPQLRALLRGEFERSELYGQRRRGNRFYSMLRALDVWNLRLRLVGNRKREQIQKAMGVAVGPAAVEDDWTFARSQLRQSNHFLALCWKGAR